MHPIFEGLGITFSRKKKVGDKELDEAMANGAESWKTLDWKVDSIRADWIPLQAGGRVARLMVIPASICAIRVLARMQCSA